MSALQALLGAVVVGLAYIARRIGGDPQLERPIILGPVIGLILGDLHSGVIVGGTLELIFIGAAPFGGTAPPNVAIATAVGTAFAVESHQGVQAALLAAVPAAVVGTLFELFAKTSCSFLVHPADRAAESASGSRIMGIVWTANAIHFLAYAVPTFLALYFGSGAVNSISHALDGDVGNGLNAAAAILPAVGFGILLSALYTKRLFPIFVIGFLIAVYTKFTVIGVGLLATAVVLVIMFRNRSTTQTS
ncbi:PTS sugar transporter subunit IIC [Streptomyces sp. TS71-3]|uniref:PTS mannose/fructose/sorbose/N-acetylgalactosamine transporter subunit IIC n=1 Tax=Streptomyces sp. TS71-3 TaxID=2733862 RepID=UPI001B1A21BA|nr:PTS sugar transporter subunit IIC [Streptomyces sp. TS71-3]GHJ41909.1 PTS mannose transporter subunit IICD [Streptomyces sp. TS71-3]